MSKFIELRRVTHKYVGGDKQPELTELEHNVVVNIDHIAAFLVIEVGPPESKVKIGRVQMDLVADEWDLSYEITLDSLNRLREETRKL